MDVAPPGEANPDILPALSDKETRMILQVIQRDEQLRQRDQYRVMKLKTELQALRRRGALRSDENNPEGRSCARCRAELGRIINRGALCKACRLRVCKGCREFGNRTTDWVCVVCQKNMELQAATGEWMHEFMRHSGLRKSDVCIPAADVIKKTIRRSWTISNPAASRWSEPRNSPEMRAYSSLPRHQDDTEGYIISKTEPKNRLSKSLNCSIDDEAEPQTPKSPKPKIQRQASVEEVNDDKTTAPKKIQFVEEMIIPKIEIEKKDYSIGSPNSSKLRERFSKSRGLRRDSKTLNVELSKSSDSGLGVSRSTEDDSETKTSKSDSERSPNFLDAVGFFTRPRSRERSVSSDSSDKNLSDMEKPSIKIRRRHEYSETRDSSSSYEGNIFDVHISNRVRRLHQVALERLSQEELAAKPPRKRTVDFGTVEYGSHEDLSKRDKPLPMRKFKSLERTDPELEEAEGRGRRRSRQERRRSSPKTDETPPSTKRLSRKDKRPFKTRRALSECHPDQRSASFFRSMTSRRKTEPNPRSIDYLKWDYSSQESEIESFLPIKKPEPVPAVEKPPVEMSKIEEKRVRGLKYEYIEIGPYLEVVGKILPVSDDYKLVFISSDSSTKGNPTESGSETESETDKKLISDCDWDYFDSNSITRRVAKDWSWSSSGGKYLSSIERSSPAFSTSDDNSPNFPRRSRFALGRSSPVSSEPEPPKLPAQESQELGAVEPVELPQEEVKKSIKKGRKKKRSNKGKEEEEAKQVAEDCTVRPPAGAVSQLETVQPETPNESAALPPRPTAAPKNKGKKSKKRKSLGERRSSGDAETASVDNCVNDGPQVAQGAFGVQPQGVVPSQLPEGFSFFPSADLSGVLPGNFLPIPVPVPIPVPFPVPAAFWSQHYTNFLYPNFNLSETLRHFPNLFAQMNANYGINPEQEIEDGLAISAWRENTTATSPGDKEPSPSCAPVGNDVECNADAKVSKSRKKRKMKKLSEPVVPPGGDAEPAKPYNDTFPRDVFVEGKTFRDVKHELKMGNQQSDEVGVECKETGDNDALLSIDKKSDCSSSSQSDTELKGTKNSYCVNWEDGKPSDDSDIADVSSIGDTKSDLEDSSPTGSEDEGNPDSRFSRIYVVNDSDSDGKDDAKNEIVLLKHVAVDENDLNQSNSIKETAIVPNADDDDGDVAPDSLDEDDALEKVVPSLHNSVEGGEETAAALRSAEPEPVPLVGAQSQARAETLGTVPSEPSNGGDFGALFLDTIESRIRHLANEAKYTSLVMITQEPLKIFDNPVRVVASDTTQVLSDNNIEHHDDISVKHTNWNNDETLEDYFTMTLESPKVHTSPKKPNVIAPSSTDQAVQVVTDEKTLSAVICLEEGLADDDSWVEDVDLERERENDFVATMTEEESSSGDEAVIQCTAYTDREEELRGYHRQAIDFTLHTIVEESCEESEIEEPVKKCRPLSATELEKYFFFDIGNGQPENNFSESSSSIYSENDINDEPNLLQTTEQNQLSSSRLESYFLGFSGDGRQSDGSVGSDSEGRPSPEQRRKRLFRSRGSNRLHSNSLDNLVQSESEQQEVVLDLEESSSENDDGEPVEGDGVKRKKKRKTSGGNAPIVILEGDRHVIVDNDGNKEPRDSLTRKHRREDEGGREEESDEEINPPQNCLLPELALNREKQQSRDSGFIGSCDDLLKEQKSGDSSGSEGKRKELTEQVAKPEVAPRTLQQSVSNSTPPASGLTRKDSFNNWSSDEETNLMMSKMRQFFKAMVSGNIPKPPTKDSPKTITKPPQLVYFEKELTRLMRTVPGIRDDQVREIVEYLSSEDTWSDSYDSSDYTSSDLEGTYHRSQLQQEISESCQQIIDKFDGMGQDERPIAPPRRNASPMNRDTAFVYQKLVASFNKMDESSNQSAPAPHSSPPFFAKVMHHIGSRLVALMHEVSSNSSGEGSITSHRARHHKRISQKLSNVSSTTEEEACISDNDPDADIAYLSHQLPRSKSHDLLLDEARKNTLRSSSDITEEKEASDYERFSWRGSFESALMAGDSRSKLTLLSNDAQNYSSSSTLVAKRRSAGDLLFSMKSLSREQLDRVRSCGSIGSAALEELWTDHRRSSVPDAGCAGSGASADGDADSSDSELVRERSTLPRSLQSIATPASSNSLPRLPVSAVGKTAGQHFLPNVKSARYRPPGFRTTQASPKRAVSAPGLQMMPPGHARRERRRAAAASAVLDSSVSAEDVHVLESPSSLAVSPNVSNSASPSPVVGSARARLRRGPSSVGSADWPAPDDDLDRLVPQHSTSSLGARSDSMASVYSGAGEGRYGTVPVRGEVEFGLQYNYKAGALEIFVKQARDLAPVDVKRNRSDPYVKVYLLPDKSKSGKRKTKVRKHTVNPVFDETLKFHIPLNGLETRTLWLTLWHCDMFGRNDFLGEVTMPLENMVFDDPTPKAYTLHDRTEPFDEVLSYKGEIIIGLKFVPPDESSLQKKGKRSRGTLHIKVKEAKNLTAVKANGTCDPFCKTYLLPDKGRGSKQKTPVQRRTCNPTWNYTCTYEDVSLQELSERCMELTVWDHDRLASNEFLGGLRFSMGTGKHYGKPVDWMDSSGKEVSLWQSMLEKPNLWVEGCLPLRPSLDPPSS